MSCMLPSASLTSPAHMPVLLHQCLLIRTWPSLSPVPPHQTGTCGSLCPKPKEGVSVFPPSRCPQEHKHVPKVCKSFPRSSSGQAERTGTLLRAKDLFWFGFPFIWFCSHSCLCYGLKMFHVAGTIAKPLTCVISFHPPDASVLSLLFVLWIRNLRVDEKKQGWYPGESCYPPHKENNKK